MVECTSAILSPPLASSTPFAALRLQLTLPIPFLFRNYVSQETALAKNLTYANHDTLILRADYTTILDARGPGRDSFRLQSNKQYLNHVAV